ncbi:MAG: manganese efflux pump [Clostridia bacterium]|nr:manganese efflux pump [Clostridia bacterium]
MDIITILLLGLGLAMDAFSVSVTDGIILKKPRFCGASKIALFFGGFQFLMPVLGYLLGSAFARYITAFDHWLAFCLLGFIGAKMIWESLHEKDECDEVKNPLDTYTLFILAIATSIDALAVGITFATMSVSVLFASTIIGVMTFAICLLGVYLGSWCGNLLGNKAEITGGLVLIGIGLKILIEHLFF